MYVSAKVDTVENSPKQKSANNEKQVVNNGKQ